MTLDIFIFLILGLITGSFLNVLVFRMDDLKSVLYTRSQCPHCQKTIAWYDLIPFLSFFLLRAKCRNCGQKISAQYPLVELGTGLLFVYLYLMFGLSLTLFYYLLVFSLLLVIFVYDLKTMQVPELFVWIVLGLSLLLGWYFGGFDIISLIAGGLIGGGFLAALAYFSKEKWMGYGDIKIGFVLGFLTGYPNAIFAMFFSFLFGSIIGLLIVWRNKGTLKTAIPFAPFLIFSTLLTLTYGQVLIQWYLGLFR